VREESGRMMSVQREGAGMEECANLIAYPCADSDDGEEDYEREEV
jgi:hypothetical protein